MTHATSTHYTTTGLDNRKLAFWAFIGSECLLFGTLISTYLVYEGRSVAGPTTHEILNIPAKLAAPSGRPQLRSLRKTQPQPR